MLWLDRYHSRVGNSLASRALCSRYIAAEEPADLFGFMAELTWTTGSACWSRPLARTSSRQAPPRQARQTVQAARWVGRSENWSRAAKKAPCRRRGDRQVGCLFGRGNVGRHEACQSRRHRVAYV